MALSLDALAVARAGRPVLARGNARIALRRGCVRGERQGSGKTSLLRVLAGLAAPAAGTVRRAA
jgi:ABC-type transport system involved in cytochrome c biogenesis ATPase subunit